MGNILSDIVNGFGNALSGITGHGRTVQQFRPPVGFTTRPNPNDPNPSEAIADALRVQHDIDRDAGQ